MYRIDKIVFIHPDEKDVEFLDNKELMSAQSETFADFYRKFNRRVFCKHIDSPMFNRWIPISKKEFCDYASIKSISFHPLSYHLLPNGSVEIFHYISQDDCWEKITSFDSIEEFNKGLTFND